MLARARGSSAARLTARPLTPRASAAAAAARAQGQKVWIAEPSWRDRFLDFVSTGGKTRPPDWAAGPAVFASIIGEGGLSTGKITAGVWRSPGTTTSGRPFSNWPAL